MSYTRRNFIKFGGLALGSLPLLTKIGLALPDSSRDMFSNLTAEFFQSLIGSEFVIYQKDSATSTVLSQIKVFKAEKKSGEECFSLLFEMPGEAFRQNSYEMFHSAIGSFELFLVPGKSDKGVPLMTAVINRV